MQKCVLLVRRQWIFFQTAVYRFFDLIWLQIGVAWSSQLALEDLGRGERREPKTSFGFTGNKSRLLHKL